MDKSTRPILDLPVTRTAILLDRFALAGVLLLIAMLTATWSDLPQRVPTHFGASGQPDGWGGKNSLLIPPAIALVIYLGFGFLARVPHLYNYPVRVTPDNVQRLYRLGRSLVLWMRLEIIWLFVALAGITLRVALGHVSGVGPAAIFVALGILYGTVGYYIVAMFRARDRAGEKSVDQDPA